MEIVWREVAILSLERARAYIAQDNPAAAERVYDRILHSVRNLANLPHIGRPDDAGQGPLTQRSPT